MIEDPKCLSSSCQEVSSNIVSTLPQNGGQEGDRESPVPRVLGIQFALLWRRHSQSVIGFIFSGDSRKCIYATKYN